MLSHPTTAVPRKDRDLVRGRLAADRVRAAGGTPTDAALEHVAAVIDQTSKHNRLKLEAENAMCRGPAHPANRQRYGAKAQFIARFGLGIDEAIAATDGWLEDVRALADRDASLARTWRVQIATLCEIKLLLRWLRRHRPAQFRQIIRALTSTADHGEGESWVA